MQFSKVTALSVGEMTSGKHLVVLCPRNRLFFIRTQFFESWQSLTKVKQLLKTSAGFKYL